MQGQQYAQQEFDFTSQAPINGKILTGQNERLLNYLEEGKTIHCFHPARKMLKIGYLNSRISDLNKHGYHIFKRLIHVKNSEGESTTVKEYSLKPFTV